MKQELIDIINKIFDRDQLITAMFELAPYPMCIEQEGIFKLVNHRWSEIFGWEESEIVGKPYIAFVHPEDMEKTTLATEIVRGGKPLVGFKNRYKRKDGHYQTVEWSARIDEKTGATFWIVIPLTD